MDCVLIGYLIHVHWINILVCCFCPDGGIWASGTMVEAATVGAGLALSKAADFGGCCC